VSRGADVNLDNAFLKLVGCIIGKGGSRINEIRVLSGAQIKISHMKDDEDEAGGRENEAKKDVDNSAVERKIMIAGSPEAISLAQYLINLRFVVSRGTSSLF